MVGYKVFKNYGIDIINKKEIPIITSWISKHLAIQANEISFLGSSNKVDKSNDLDVALLKSNHNIGEFYNDCSKILGVNNVINHNGLNIISICADIKDLGKKVQIDFMFVSDIEWAKFAYFSPGNKSEYKGAIRTLLLMSMTALINEKGIDYFRYDEDKLVLRAGRTFSRSDGIRRIFQYLPKRKNGNDYLKNLKTLSKDEFFEKYKDLDINNNNIYITDINKAIKLMTGYDICKQELETTEQIINIIKNLTNRDKIFEIAKNKANIISHKMKLPMELRN